MSMYRQVLLSDPCGFSQVSWIPEDSAKLGSLLRPLRGRPSLKVVAIYNTHFCVGEEAHKREKPKKGQES